MSGAAPPGRIAASLGKVEALAALLAEAGSPPLTAPNQQAAAALATLGSTLGRRANIHVGLHKAASIQGSVNRLLHGAATRTLVPARHLSGMPECFSDQSAVAHSPELRTLILPGGYYCHYPDGPLIVAGSGDIVVSDYSSPYAGLVHYYDVELRPLLADALQVNGTVIVLADDVRPLNYCHWLVDWLPRLAALGERARREDTYVAVPPLNGAWQWDSLRLCGFPPERVIELQSWQAVRARHLLVPSDLHDPPHPGHKAAPWLLQYLRATLGYGAFLAGLDGPQRRGRLYLSRNSAGGRRIVNEDELVAALLPLGYHKADTNGLTLLQQIALFATASHIVAPHGAGLANIVFADPATTLVELFPHSYGTAAYYVLAAGLGMTYASHISTTILPGDRSQLDDFEVNVDDFMTRCGPLL